LLIGWIWVLAGIRLCKFWRISR